MSCSSQRNLTANPVCLSPCVSLPSSARAPVCHGRQGSQCKLTHFASVLHISTAHAQAEPTAFSSLGALAQERGCKLWVQAPSGGSVRTDSGAVACAGAPGPHGRLHALAGRPGLQAPVRLDAPRGPRAGAGPRPGRRPRHHWPRRPAAPALLAQQARPGVHGAGDRGWVLAWDQVTECASE